MLNRSILIGRLTRDPELRYTPTGTAVCNFTIAVDRPFANDNGEREVDFIPVVVWKKPAENAANYLRKGRLAAVEGRIQTRNYENNEGRRIYVTEVVADNIRFLEPKERQERQEEQSDRYTPSDNRVSNVDPFADDGKPIDISDDDLPF